MFTARRYEHDKWQCHFFFRSDQTMIALYGAIYRKAHSFPTPKFDVMNGEILVHDRKKIFGILIVPIKFGIENYKSKIVK